MLESFQTQAEGYFDDLNRLVLGRERAGELPDPGRGLLRRSGQVRLVQLSSVVRVAAVSVVPPSGSSSTMYASQYSSHSL